MVTGTISSTRWSFPSGNLCPSTSNNIDLSQIGGGSCSVVMGMCGPNLLAANQPPATPASPCQTSTLSITANATLNGLVAQCTDLQNSMMIGNTTIMIRIVGKQQAMAKGTKWNIKVPVGWSPDLHRWNVVPRPLS